MGNALTAIPGDENSIYHNPAGLAYVEGGKLSFNIFLQNYSINNPVLGTEFNNFQFNGTIFFVKNRFGIVIGIWRRGDAKGRQRFFYERFVCLAFGGK